jgi:hypothetical protein
MSTLLKKKYCKEHDRSCAATDSVSDRDEAAIQNAEPCSLSTITDENSSFEGDCDPVSDQGKSVQFDLDRIVVINGKDRETLHQHREDIWYTVSFNSRRGHQRNCTSHAVFIVGRYSAKNIGTSGQIA